jgi:hypothetical protein
MKLPRSAALLCLAVLGACAPIEEPEPVEPPKPQPVGSCPVIESRDWAAWVNAMPGPSATRELIVTGQVTMPTPGYALTLTAGMADRSATPVQQLVLSAVPPSGMVPQVLATEAVRYQGPAISMTYRAVRIMCGGTMLTEISDVQVAH